MRTLEGADVIKLRMKWGGSQPEPTEPETRIQVENLFRLAKQQTTATNSKSSKEPIICTMHQAPGTRTDYLSQPHHTMKPKW